MSSEDLSDLNFASIARSQGITRAGVARRAKTWSRKELLQGHRDKPENSSHADMPSKYHRYADQLGGFSAEAVAKHNKISVSGLYYKLQRGKPFLLPGECSDQGA